MTGLLSLLSRFNSRQLPTPLKFEQMIGQVASYEFLSKPSAALVVMHSGVPSQYKPFWEQVSVSALYSIYQAQSASHGTVLKMLEDAVSVDAHEERILGYLRQFVGSMGSDALRNFLRFVTGSSVCSSLQIHVTFNAHCLVLLVAPLFIPVVQHLNFLVPTLHIQSLLRSSMDVWLAPMHG